MTIDVEDYFHVSAFEGVIPRTRWGDFDSRVRGNTERLLQLFDAHGITATFFILGWVAERFPRLVAQIARLGHEVASHGYGHHLVYRQTQEEFREDIRRAKGVIEDAGGVAAGGYRAPSYSITPRSIWALDVLIEVGHVYDASIFPIYHDQYGFPGAPRHPYAVERKNGRLVEAPASTVRLGPLNVPVAGGGYFRILPYAWTRWGITRVNRWERRPTIFYLHPWEIDPDQPRIPAGWLSRFRHYRNLEKTEHRLRRLLREFAFGPLEDVLREVTSAPSAKGGPRPARDPLTKGSMS